MKKYYLIVILLGIISIKGSYGQTKTTMHLLTKHIWTNKDKTCFFKFDTKSYYWYENLEKYGYKKDSGTQKYYLSDSPSFIEAETTTNYKYNKVIFKETLVGKVQNGIYIITPNRSIWIQKISADSLIFIADAPGAIRQILVPYYGEFPKE